MSPRPEDLPLSYRIPLPYSMLRVWWFYRRNPQDPFCYAGNFAFRIRGRLEIAKIIQAWEHLVERHEVLRTLFPEKDGAPCQVIQSKNELLWAFVDLTIYQESEREARFHQRINEEKMKCHNLEAGPLFRIGIYRLDQEVHVMAIHIHHILYDGVSTMTMFSELAYIYNSLASETPILLPPPTQIADFAIWERAHFTGSVMEELSEYWKQTLVGAPCRLELPSDYPRKERQAHSLKEYHFTMDPDLAEGVRNLNLQSGTTPFMVFLTALNLFICKQADKTDIVVGTWNANRHLAEHLEEMLGCITNSIVFRCKLETMQSLSTALEQVRKVVLDVYDHQAMPFELLVQQMGYSYMPTHYPIFQVALNVHSEGEVRQRQHRRLAITPTPAQLLQWEPIDIGSRDSTNSLPETAQEVGGQDLALSFTSIEETLKGHWEYNENLFTEDTICRWHKCYVRMLQILVNRPSLTVEKAMRDAGGFENDTP